MPNKPVTRRPSGTRQFGPTVFKPKPKIKLKEDTKNPHIKTINTMFSSAKTVAEKINKVSFSANYFLRKKRSLENILNLIANKTNPEKIYKEFKDFDIGEFEAIGENEYRINLAKEINSLKQAYNYADNILRRLKK
jgi:predicted DNA-binding antitoxin AbrB/MazE fold protein